MKKLCSLIVAVVMVLSVTVTAFAAAPGDSEEIDVTGKYNSTVTEGTVYSVDIAWENMTFTYNETTEKVWNADSHSYTTTTTGSWDKTTASITIINHSNAAVSAAISFAAVAGTGVTGTLNKTQKTLSAGVEGKPNEADALVTTLTIGGKPTETVTKDGIKVGSITITLS